MSSDTASVILDWTEAVNRHDPDAYARYFDDDLLGAWSNLRLEVVNVLSGCSH
jgi:ketosteroid isomerase-like protein